MTLLQHALKNADQRCFCNSPLMFRQESEDLVVCHCPRCDLRALHEWHVINVYGYGRSVTAAHEDWLRAQESF